MRKQELQERERSCLSEPRCTPRLAKATLSLIPLLGISYLLTTFVQCNQYNNAAVMVVKYLELFYVSVQVCTQSCRTYICWWCIYTARGAFFAAVATR